MVNVRDKTKLMIRRRIDSLRDTNNIEERSEIYNFSRGMLYVGLHLGILSTHEDLELQRYLQLVYDRKVEDEAKS